MDCNNLASICFKDIEKYTNNLKLFKRAINFYLDNSQKFKQKKKKSEYLTSRGEKRYDKLNEIKCEDQHEFIEQVRSMFHRADLDGSGSLDMNEFAIEMRKTFPHYSMKDLKILYMKIDTNCNNAIDLTEYLTYILFEHQEREHMFEMSRPKPYPKSPKQISLKSVFWDRFVSFHFYPSLSRNGVQLNDIDNLFGRYVTITKEGLVAQLNLNLKILKQSYLFRDRKKNKSTWITAMVPLPNMNYIAVSNTENNISFYDLNSTVEHAFIITKLPSVVTCMDYTFSLKTPNDSFLFCGDKAGNIFMFYPREHNRPMFHIGDTTSSLNKDSNVRIYEFPRLKDNLYASVSIRFVESCHPCTVIKINWIEHLKSVLSCSSTNQKSLFMGNFDNKNNRYFSSEKGFTCFTYAKKLNMIVTGGYDRLIKMWEPFVTSKPSNILHGHNWPIAQICVDERENTLISIDKKKNLIIWYLATSKILQTISLGLQENVHIDVSCMYLNEKMHKLIICHDKILAFEHSNEIYLNNERSTHVKPVLCMIYNSLFDFVITADSGSVINVWDLQTGNKIMHILNAHQLKTTSEYEVSSEITALTFDESMRQLISGSHSGSICFWNFNNGSLLRKLKLNENENDESNEITCILHKDDRLFVTGWNREIFVYYIGNLAQVQLLMKYKIYHESMIMSMDLKNKLLATASYDGHIYLWSIEFGEATFQIKTSESLKLENVEKVLKQQKRPQKLTNNCLCREDGFKSLMDKSIYRINKILFFKKRYNKVLITSGAEGWIKVWLLQINTHDSINLLGQFNASHKPGSSITEMCFDKDEMLLFTGDSLGYIKIWFIGNYCNQEETDILAEKRDYYLKKFYDNDRDELKILKEEIEMNRRAKLGYPSLKNELYKQESIKNIKYPILLRSFRAHVEKITSLYYVDDKELIISSSYDTNVRLFTLQGRYFGLFGQDKTWNLDEDLRLKLANRIPLDLHRVASSNTFKVVRGSISPRWKLIQQTVMGVFFLCKYFINYPIN